MAARGLAGLPLTVVLLAGEGQVLAGLKLGPLASNVMLQPPAPRAKFFPWRMLAALRAGLPAVVLPSIWDEAEMAWRVAP